MTKVYTVTEGQTDIAILQKLLPQDIVRDTEFVAGSGRYSAQSLASSILVAKRKPVALIFDADTDNDSAFQEQIDFATDLLRRVASGVPFKVFAAVPEIEVVFFEDQPLLEWLTGHKFSDMEWEIARSRPKTALRVVQGEHTFQVKDILNRLNEEAIQVLRKNPLIEDLEMFLSSIVVNAG